MEDEEKVNALAKLILEKHRNEALALLSERIKGRLRVRDYHLVVLWARVAAALQGMLPDAGRRPHISGEIHEVATDFMRTMGAQQPVSNQFR